MKVKAEWTPDCSGKQDFDGPIVELSTRYWPRGGSFLTFTRTEGFRGPEMRPEIRPSAHASIYLRQADDDGELESATLADEHFEGETEAEVKAAVEAWAQARYDEIAAVLQKHFAVAQPEGTKP